MKKKFLKIGGILLAIFVLILIGIPIFLESKIGPIIRNNVNNSIQGEFDFEDADLSLFANFPNARVSLTNIVLTPPDPFKQDTLFTASEAYLVMGIGELFKGAGDPIGIREIYVEDADLFLLVDENDQANYDIAREDSTSGEISGEEGFRFDLRDYSLKNARVRYSSLGSGITFELDSIQHRGTGDLSLSTSELQTQTMALISFSMDSVEYLHRNPLDLEALIGIDLDTDTYSFKENRATINRLPLVFEGSVKLIEEGQDLDLTFSTPTSDFKNFLGMIPEMYTKSIEGVTTTGDFSVEGQIKGISSDERIPGFEILMEAENASFKYPDLPRSVSNINLSARVKNETGNTEDTFIQISDARFTIDGDAFKGNAEIREILGNPKVKAGLNGKMNLAHLSEAYPLPSDLNLQGILTADVNTGFDMASIEAKRYENTTTSGNMQVQNFEFRSEELTQPLELKTVSMTFNPKTVNLQTMEGKLGQTDFKINGTIDNLLGALFNDETIQGRFNLNSQKFVLNDFMTSESTSESSPDTTNPEEAIKIPSFLDCVIDARANTVVYDNLPLNEVSARLVIRDEKAILENMSSKALEGSLVLNGSVSTKNDTPEFAMELGIADFDIGETLETLELFQTLAPIASILEGTLNTRLSLSGKLTNDFTPELMSLAGNAVAEVFASEINGKKARVLDALDSKLDFINMEALDMRKLKTILSFEDGLVKVRPFTFSYKDIAITVEGGHTFDQQLNYRATLDVPAKYLGSRVNELLTQLNEPELNQATIPVMASIGGNYSNPTVSTDLTAGIQNFTSRLIEIQKQKLITGGKEKAKDLIGQVLKNSDSTKTSRDTVVTGLGNVIKDVLSGTTKKKDTVTVRDTTQVAGGAKKTAQELLGNLFKKKKDTSATKDSIN